MRGSGQALKARFNTQKQMQAAAQALHQGLVHGRTTGNCKFGEAVEVLSQRVKWCKEQRSVKSEKKTSSSAPTSDLQQSYNALGLLHLHQGTLASAHSYLNSALELSKESKHNLSSTAGLLNDTAIVASRQGKTETAKNNLLQALEMTNSVVNPLIRIATNVNLGELYISTGNYPVAEKYLRQATTGLSKQLSQETETTDSSRVLAATVHGSLGRLLLFNGNDDEALDLLSNSASIISNTDGAAHPVHGKSLSNLALFHLSHSNLVTAHRLLTEAQSSLRESVGKRHLDSAICENNMASVVGFSSASRLLRSCGKMCWNISKNGGDSDAISQCLVAVQHNQALLKRLCGETSAKSGANMMEAMQINEATNSSNNSTRIKLMSHAYHMTGLGM